MTRGSTHLKVRLTWAVIATFATAWIFYAFFPKAIEVEVAPVVRGNLTVTVNHQGKTRIKDRYVISAPMAGKMKRIDLRAGDFVREGVTVITVLEPADPELLDERTRGQAEARVKAAEAALSRNETILKRARTSFQYAAVELERAQALFESRSISHQELDNLEEKKHSSSEDQRSAEHSVQIARYELDLARAALLRTSREPGKGTEEWDLPILAPISGQVLRVLHTDASPIVTGTPLIELGDPVDLEMEIDVLSTDGVNVRPGARVIVENWGGKKPLEGKVRVVEPAAFTKISALGVEEQRVNVIADFLGNPTDRVGLGDAYRIEARIVVTELTNVLKIPTASLFRIGDRWAVFTVQNERARLQNPNLIDISQSESAIKGLAETDWVIVFPSDRVKAGKRVVKQISK